MGVAEEGATGVAEAEAPVAMTTAVVVIAIVMTVVVAAADTAVTTEVLPVECGGC